MTKGKSLKDLKGYPYIFTLVME